MTRIKRRVRSDSERAYATAVAALTDVLARAGVAEPHEPAQAFMRSLLADGWRPTTAYDRDPVQEKVRATPEQAHAYAALARSRIVRRDPEVAP